MNQYEQAAAVRKIEGYDLQLGMPRKPREVEFQDAKKECLAHLRTQLANLEALTFEQYISERREQTAKQQEKAA